MSKKINIEDLKNYQHDDIKEILSKSTTYLNSTELNTDNKVSSDIVIGNVSDAIEFMLVQI